MSGIIDIVMNAKEKVLLLLLLTLAVFLIIYIIYRLSYPIALMKYLPGLFLTGAGIYYFLRGFSKITTRGGLNELTSGVIFGVIGIIGLLFALNIDVLDKGSGKKRKAKLKKARVPVKKNIKANDELDGELSKEEINKFKKIEEELERKAEEKRIKILEKELEKKQKQRAAVIDYNKRVQEINSKEKVEVLDQIILFFFRNKLSLSRSLSNLSFKLRGKFAEISIDISRFLYRIRN